MFKLIVSIVPHDCGELITGAAAAKGAGGGTIMMARGTAQSNIIQLLGLGDTSKDIAYVIVEDSIYDDVRKEIISATENKKKSFGVLFSINIGDFIKAGHTEDSAAAEKTVSKDKEGEEMNYTVINVIVNKGYADDAMAAARKAGAGGGTILSARGTAKEGDAKFLGMEIVPEKDLLMIVVPAENADQVVQAIKELPCMQKAGSGIIFCSKAHDFTLLGKK